MKKVSQVIFIALIIFIVQTACAVGGTATQDVQPTQDVQALVNTSVALTQAANAWVIPTNTSEPMIKLPTIAPILPTDTLAPILASSIQGTVNYGANCRFGPGANFLNLVVLDQGTQVDVIGTAKATDKTTWWLTQSSGNPDCWLLDAALTITGDKTSIAKVVSPPTPTPEPPPNWTGSWNVWQWQGIYIGGEYEEKFIVTMVQTGSYLSWTYSVGGYPYTGQGTVSEDGMLVLGTESSTYPGANFGVRFVRNPSNLNQFRGRWWWSGDESMDGAYCGAIKGAGKPSPCKP